MMSSSDYLSSLLIFTIDDPQDYTMVTIKSSMTRGNPRTMGELRAAQDGHRSGLQGEQ